jgi:hypothetical protein
MTWIEITEEITKKTLTAVAKIIVFIVWLVLTPVQLLLTELLKTMKAWLFPGRR